MEATNQATGNRMVLLLIAGIPVIMLLAASWLWYFVVRGDLDVVGLLGTANRGTLVQPPRQLDEVDLLDQTGAVIRYGDLEPRWTMLVPSTGGVCEQHCERSLYLTRQIHMAMGKEYNRLRRVYISATQPPDTALAVTVLSDGHPAPADFAELLQSEHRGLKALVLDPQTYKELFVERQAEPSSWYLVDPAGWIMMSYDKGVDYKDVISDLKFLLKNSSE